MVMTKNRAAAMGTPWPAPWTLPEYHARVEEEARLAAAARPPVEPVTEPRSRALRANASAIRTAIQSATGAVVADEDLLAYEEPHVVDPTIDMASDAEVAAHLVAMRNAEDAERARAAKDARNARDRARRLRRYEQRQKRGVAHHGPKPKGA